MVEYSGNDLPGLSSGDDLKEILYAGTCNMVYQPILELRSKKIYGYEALLRGMGGVELPSPEHLFSNGYLPADILVKLDMCCVGSSLRAGSELAKEGRLFINIHAATLCQLALNLEAFKNLLAELGIRPEKIVFEISERTDLRCAPEVEKNLREFVSLGIRIAIDDIGSSFNWLHHMLDTRPSYLKVDKAFISDCNASRRKQALVRSLNMMAGTMGLQLVAEGIENARQAALLSDIGVSLVQGYWFGRPQPAYVWTGK